MLASQLKQRVAKQKFSHLQHLTHGGKVQNPKDIANTISTLYSSLYNLKDDPHTSQPFESLISEILDGNTLPKLSDKQIQTLHS